MSKVALSEHIITVNAHRGKAEQRCSEDYIQTLGVNFMEKSVTIRNTEINFSVRRNPTCPNKGFQGSIMQRLDLGSRWSTRICFHASVGFQRCCRYPLHVRLDAESYLEQHKRVV